ncbi:hypothetical protein MTR_0027s0140 [Medicago truncatula]|uniref:Uncharacterized protein n=1 Tax=Medicago truncatula TaxID=3880 RepID=A0A072TIP2_MEDTR|nr:hypothetical protein MTR_0027s0140 [Medicago truncatula]
MSVSTRLIRGVSVLHSLRLIDVVFPPFLCVCMSSPRCRSPSFAFVVSVPLSSCLV